MGDGAGLDVDAVIEAVRRWSYLPHRTVRVETGEYQLLRLPDWWAQPLELRRFTPARPLETVLDEVLAVCRRFKLPRVCCWVRWLPRRNCCRRWN